MLLTSQDIEAIALAVAKQSTTQPDEWYPPEVAAKLLGILDNKGNPTSETVRRWCRDREVFQPGTEVIKVGKFWSINVTGYRKRKAKELKMTRNV